VKTLGQSLSENVRSRREDLGLSQTELANKAKISLYSVHRIETGKTTPRASVLKALAGVFGCSVEDLYQVPGAAVDARQEAQNALVLVIAEKQREIESLKSQLAAASVPQDELTQAMNVAFSVAGVLDQLAAMYLLTRDRRFLDLFVEGIRKPGTAPIGEVPIHDLAKVLSLKK
jgi:transcriptional regulator with XRE-family HTH domain